MCTRNKIINVQIKFTEVHNEMTDDELLVTVAGWYYEEQIGQSEIAKRLNKSRSMVSRLLNEARQRGLVEIKIKWPLLRDDEVERRICEKFGLKEAWVSSLAMEDNSTLLRVLGTLGAQCFKQLIQSGMSISVGWGRSLYEVVRAMPETRFDGCHVIQAIGAVGRGDQLTEGTELVRWLSQKTGATFQYLPSPLFVEDEVTAKLLLDLDVISQTLNAAKNADIALVGIGALDPPTSSLFQEGHLSNKEIEYLKTAGSVGTILGYQLGSDGTVLDVAVNKRIIGLSPDDLAGIGTVIGVAGGKEKASVILASLVGGYLDVLVTDRDTAHRVLELEYQSL